jgi:hypothetical protein
MKRWFGLLSVACLVAATTAACTGETSSSSDGGPPDAWDICQLAYYPEGLNIRYSADRINGFPDGAYRVDVIADGERLSIAGTAVGQSMTCPDTDDGWECRASLDVADGRHLMLRLDHSALSGTIQLWYADGDEPAGGPAFASVELYLMDASIGAGVYQPSYLVHEPNGVGCGIATQASAELDVATL